MSSRRSFARRSVCRAVLAAALLAGTVGASPALAQVNAARAAPGAMPDYPTPGPFRAANGKYGFEMKPEDVYGEGVGRVVIAPRFDFADRFYAGQETAAVLVNGRWGRIDQKGREVVPIQFDWAEDCIHGMAVVWANGKAGAWDCKAGRMTVEPQFAYLGPFTQAGNAPAVRTNRWGLVDRTGKELAPFDHALVRSYASGWSSVVKDRQEYYLNPLGQKAYPFGGGWMVGLDAGPVWVRNDKGMYALLGPDGREIGGFDYSSLKCAEGLCVAVKGGKAGVLNAAGAVVSPFQWDSLEWHEDHFLGSQGGRWSFIDKAGRPLAGGQTFLEAAPFDAEGFAVVRNDKLWYLIDRKGKQITPKGLTGRERLPEVRHTPTGLIVAMVDRKAGAVDHAGNIVIPFQYLPAPLTEVDLNPLWVMAEPLSPRPAPLWEGELRERGGLMGLDGKWLIPPGRYRWVTGPDWTRREKNRTLTEAWLAGEMKWAIVDAATNREVFPAQNRKLMLEETWARLFGANGIDGAVRLSDMRVTQFADASIEDWAEPLDLFVVRRGELEGVLDPTGRVVVPIAYDRVVSTRHPTLPFYAARGGVATLFDARGQAVMTGLEPVGLGTRWKSMEPTADADGYLTMVQGGQPILLDGKGRVVARANDMGARGAQHLYMTQIGPLKVPMALVPTKPEEAEHYILLNGQAYHLFSGKAVTTGLEFRDGLLPVEQNGKWGYIDMYGRLAIPLQFDAARGFSNGRAEVRKDGVSRLINPKGEIQAYADMGLVIFNNGFPKPAPAPGTGGSTTPAPAPPPAPSGPSLSTVPAPKPEEAWDQTIDKVAVKPETAKTLGILCTAEWWYKDQTEDPDSEAQSLAEKKVFDAAGVKTGDAEPVIRRKVRSFWTAYRPFMTCGQKGGIFGPHGGLMNVAIKGNWDPFRTSMIARWRIPVNDVDPIDGRTALDMVDDQELGGRRMYAFRRSLIQRGAKNRKDLDGVDCRRGGLSTTAKPGCPQE
jgi:hypothetical protein